MERGGGGAFPNGHSLVQGYSARAGGALLQFCNMHFTPSRPPVLAAFKWELVLSMPSTQIWCPVKKP